VIISPSRERNGEERHVVDRHRFDEGLSEAGHLVGVLERVV
jgi:hypothetical protein